MVISRSAGTSFSGNASVLTKPRTWAASVPARMVVADISSGTFMFLASLCACAVDHGRPAECAFSSRPHFPLFVVAPSLVTPSVGRTMGWPRACSPLRVWFPPNTIATARVPSCSFWPCSGLLCTRRGDIGTTQRGSVRYIGRLDFRHSNKRRPIQQLQWDGSTLGRCGGRTGESRIGACSPCVFREGEVPSVEGRRPPIEQESCNFHGLLSRFNRPAHIPPSVWDKLDRKLYKRPDNPIGIVKKRIEHFFISENERTNLRDGGQEFPTFLFPSPVVLQQLCSLLDGVSFRGEPRRAGASDTGPLSTPCSAPVPPSSLASSHGFPSSATDIACATDSVTSQCTSTPAFLSRAEKRHYPIEPTLGVSAYQLFDDFSPVVTCQQNFDSLLVPLTHVSRRPSDTYYLEHPLPSNTEEQNRNDSTSTDRGPRSCSCQTGGARPYDPSRLLLRTHGTAHQKDLIDRGVRAAIWTVEVVRRDEIDRLHYPVFHQTDGFRLFFPRELRQLQEEHALLLALLPQLLDLVRRQLDIQSDNDREPELSSQVQGTGSVVGSRGSPSGKGDRLLHPAAEILNGEVAAMGASYSPGVVRVSREVLEWISQSPALVRPNPLLGNPVVLHLQLTLERLLRHVLGPHVQLKWDYDTSFPFTEPSIELYVAATGPPAANDQALRAAAADSDSDGAAEANETDAKQWVEVLGAGEIRRAILEASPAAFENKQEAEAKTAVGTASTHVRGWAFGLGLERLCMRLFGIDDIRLFWSTDSRFTDQFADGQVRHFLPFSSMPPVYKDISFWVNAAQGESRAAVSAQGQSAESTRISDASTVVEKPQGSAYKDSLSHLKNTPSLVPGTARVDFNEMSFYELCREVGGDLVESVKLVDSFVHPKTRRKSVCYRLTYRALDRTLTHQEVNAVQETVYRRVGQTFNVDLR
ncbi:ferredoxin-fold anticodon binding domain-containing protein [Cystoisospora suis]|uniref:phenylalanine--tRNA ligase n=1 Tax=Cystoisospora suis TaxID=483139 RepID=A0A2C6KJQ0_9APIC|nr:ferredoxin-fold anticodon binding domain-containing protein [Cystoisospora suis]